MPTEVLGGTFFGFDNWQGYPQEREQLLTFIRDQKINDVIFVTGDIHTFITGDVQDGDGHRRHGRDRVRRRVDHVTGPRRDRPPRRRRRRRPGQRQEPADEPGDHQRAEGAPTRGSTAPTPTITASPRSRRRRRASTASSTGWRRSRRSRRPCCPTAPSSTSPSRAGRSRSCRRTSQPRRIVWVSTRPSRAASNAAAAIARSWIARPVESNSVTASASAGRASSPVRTEPRSVTSPPSIRPARDGAGQLAAVRRLLPLVAEQRARRDGARVHLGLARPVGAEHVQVQPRPQVGRVTMSSWPA